MKNKTFLVLAAFVSISLFCVFAEEAVNLLKNGNFAESIEGGAPSSWRSSESENPTTVDASEHPENTEKSMKVVLKKTASNYGSIGQDIAWAKENTKMVLAGDMKSSKKGMACLQIKLKKGKEELKGCTTGVAEEKSFQY